MKSQESAKFAVIGAGMAGLTATQKLLAGGAEVTLIEKLHGPGGRASTLERDSFFLNQGPHALYKGGAAYEILTKLKIIPAAASPAPKRSLAIFKGEILDLPIDTASLMATKLLSIGEKIEWAFLMGTLAHVDVSRLHRVPLCQWLDSTIRSERIRNIFAAFVRLSTYCNNPEKISAAAAIQQLIIAQKDGVLYLDHGWQSLVNAMVLSIEQTLQREGQGKLTEIYEAEVTNISVHTTDAKHEEDQVEITVNGAKHNFDAVILALPPQQVSRLLVSVSDENTLLRATLDDIVPSHAACLDVCLKKLPNLDNTFAIGIDEPLYYSVHSTTAKLAEANHALIHLAVYLPEGEKGSDKHEHQLLELLDKMQPGWQNELVYKRFLANMTASFGTALAAKEGSNGLASVTLPIVPKVDRVFVCGDWVGTGHLLVDAAMSSAVTAAEAALAGAKKKACARI